MTAHIGDKVVLIPLDSMHDNIVALTPGYSVGNAHYIDISPSGDYYVSHDCDYASNLYYTVGSGTGNTIEYITLNLTAVAALFNNPILVVPVGSGYDQYYTWNTDPEVSALLSCSVNIGTWANSVFYAQRVCQLEEGEWICKHDTLRTYQQTAMGNVSKSGNTTISLIVWTENGSKGRVHVSSRAMIVEGSV